MGELVSLRCAPRLRRAAALLVCCAACGDDSTAAAFPGLVAVSANAPWSASCAPSSGLSGQVFPNAEVEPAVAADPHDPKHLIGVWQQDRWSNGGANGTVSAATFDGGHTWTLATAPFTLCSGGEFQRATDPWVSISPDGTAYQIAFAFDQDQVNRAMLVSRSTDGGRTWQAPVKLQNDTDPDLSMDKETITADPLDSAFAYAVWDRLTGSTSPNNPQNTGPTWFARTTDHGATWEPAHNIYDPGADAQTISNQVVVLPGGTLVNLLMVITQNSTASPHATVSVLRSADKGVTWSATPVAIAEAQFVGVSDFKSKRGIRTGSVVPAIAVDRQGGALYVAWEDARFSAFQRDGIAISRSVDGGLTWSPPAQVNGAASPAFTPAIAVAQDGKVGVSYYDLRNDPVTDHTRLMVTHWLAVSSDGGATFTETMIGAPFNLQLAPVVDGPAWFLGDYQGLTSAGGVFLPFFVAVPDGGKADVYFRPADAPAAKGSPVAVVAHSVQQMWRGARERWRFGTLFK